MAISAGAAAAAQPQTQSSKPAVKVTFESHEQLTRVHAVLRDALGIRSDEPLKAVGRGHVNLLSRAVRGLDPERGVHGGHQLVLLPRPSAEQPPLAMAVEARNRMQVIHPPQVAPQQ